MMTRRSWPLVLFCASVVIALSMGIRQISGLLLRPVVVDLALTRDAFGMAVALQNLVWGLTQPLAGLIADRYGPRYVVAGTGILYVAGLGLAAGAQSGAMFILGLGVVCGLAQAGTAFAVILAAVGRAAPARVRSMALGIGSMAGSLGMFLMVPVTHALLDIFDWRGTLFLLAALCIAMPILAAALQERNGIVEANPTSARDAARAAGMNRDFWLLNVGFATCGFQLALVVTYLPTILADHGLDVSIGATVLATIGAFNIVGTYIAGAAGGRFRKSRVLLAIYLMRAAAIAAFLATPITAASAIAFGATIGLLWTGTVPLTSGLVADLWGQRNLGFLFGVVYVGHQVGAFVGSYAGGVSFEATGNFEMAWAATIVLSLAAALCHFALRDIPRSTVGLEAR